MILLSFAHRNEAQCFFEHFQLSPSKDNPRLWLGDKISIIITGEGQFESLHTISTVLAQNTQIKSVINLGITGSLNQQFKNHDIFTIRTAYLTLENQAQFKSFPLQIIDGLEICDCLTSSNRVLDTKTRELLSPFADLVDRELWSIGFACSKFKIPLASIKVVSDTADSNEKNICEEIKEEAYIFSKILLNVFLKYNSFDDEKQDEIPHEHELYQLLHNDDYYFTLAMKRKFKNLVKQVILRKSKTQQITLSDFDMFENTEGSRKDRATKVLSFLTETLNPLRTELEKQLVELTIPLVKTGWTIKYDSNIEEKWISLSTKIQDTAQLHKLSETLKNFPLEDWQNIFEGKSDV